MANRILRITRQILPRNVLLGRSASNVLHRHTRVRRTSAGRTRAGTRSSQRFKLYTRSNVNTLAINVCAERSRTKFGCRLRQPTRAASACANSRSMWVFQRERCSRVQSAKARHDRFSQQSRWQSTRMLLLPRRLGRSHKGIRERAERHVERMAGISERGVDHIETMDEPGILRSIDQIEKLDKVARRTYDSMTFNRPARFRSTC